MGMRKTESLKAGLFIITTVGLFALIIFVMGSEKQIFSDQEEYHTVFKDVKGLVEGAPVRLAGITVGRVAGIGFSKNTKDARVHVRLLINEKYLDRIHSDSVATIETQGLLGDRYLSIVAGKEKELLPPGSTLESMEASEIAEVLNKASQIVDNTVKVSANVNNFIKRLGEETLDEVTRGARSFSELMGEIEKGDGLLHRMIYSKKDGDQILKALSETSRDLNELVREIKHGEGFLNALVYDPEGGKALRAFSTASEAIASFSSSVSDISDEIRNGDGLAHQLIYGDRTEDLNAIIAKLNQAADNFKKASQALADGSGTLGALMVDPLLYDKLVEITDSAQRSLILRYAIRSSLDK